MGSKWFLVQSAEASYSSIKCNIAPHREVQSRRHGICHRSTEVVCVKFTFLRYNRAMKYAICYKFFFCCYFEVFCGCIFWSNKT